MNKLINIKINIPDMIEIIPNNIKGFECFSEYITIVTTNGNYRFQLNDSLADTQYTHFRYIVDKQLLKLIVNTLNEYFYGGNNDN